MNCQTHLPQRAGRSISALRRAALIAGALPLLTGCTSVEPFGMVQHTSDITRGPPFHEPEGEPTQEYVSGGVTIEAGRFELDVSHGAKKINGREWETGSQLTSRWYPTRQ